MVKIGLTMVVLSDFSLCMTDTNFSGLVQFGRPFLLFHLFGMGNSSNTPGKLCRLSALRQESSKSILNTLLPLQRKFWPSFVHPARSILPKILYWWSFPSAMRSLLTLSVTVVFAPRDCDNGNGMNCSKLSLFSSATTGTCRMRVRVLLVFGTDLKVWR